MELTIQHGTALVKLARKIVEKKCRGDLKPGSKGYIRENLSEFLNLKGIGDDTIKELGEILEEKSGVFVTLHTYPAHHLRGCIGYPEPLAPLYDALFDSAISAATRDPRFPPVSEEEIESLIVEVSVLTKPEIITVKNPKDYPEKIKIGSDGLIVERGFFKGLLLPQVPVEWKWNTKEFLRHTCAKAGLEPDAWLDLQTKIYKFSSIIFSEVKPGGEVVESGV